MNRYILLILSLFVIPYSFANGIKVILKPGTDPRKDVEKFRFCKIPGKSEFSESAER